MERRGHLTDAVGTHGLEHLTQHMDAIETGPTGTTQMLLDRTAIAGVEALLEEVERGTRVEMTVVGGGLLQGFLRAGAWGGWRDATLFSPTTR